MATLTIAEDGQILLPLEVNRQLNLKNNDWLKVSIKSDRIVLIPPREVDEELIAVLIHEGVIIQVPK